MTFVRIWRVKIVFVHIVVELVDFLYNWHGKNDFLLLGQHGNSQGPKSVQLTLKDPTDLRSGSRSLPIEHTLNETGFYTRHRSRFVSFPDTKDLATHMQTLNNSTGVWTATPAQVAHGLNLSLSRDRRLSRECEPPQYFSQMDRHS